MCGGGERVKAGCKKEGIGGGRETRRRKREGVGGGRGG